MGNEKNSQSAPGSNFTVVIGPMRAGKTVLHMLKNGGSLPASRDAKAATVPTANNVGLKKQKHGGIGP